MYLKIENNTPFRYSIEQLRQDNPLTSFPREPSDSLLASYNVFNYTKTNTVAPNGYVLGSGEFRQVDGSWVLEQPLIVDENYEEPSTGDKVRRQRNSLLRNTDWWATSDRTMTSEQTAYRQELRDITEQEHFPNTVTWPTKPE